MKKYLRYLGSALVAAIFLLAAYLLHHKLKAYSIAQIRASLSSISYARVGLSFLLMIVNYLILVGYDWLALKAICKKLPLPHVGLVSFVGQAVSYNFGALLGGTTVRWRFYSAWGFTLAEIVRLVLMLAVTFWVGALGLCGAIFMFAPPIIPEELLAKMPISDVRVLGLILFLFACSYLALCGAMRKPLHVFGREFVFPAPRIAAAQVVVAGVDIIVAASCMYVLLPDSIGVSFLDFLPGYLMAQIAVVLTHVPGGVGVFELVILHLTHTVHEQVVFAAVLVFRLVYYIIPLLAAAVLLAVYEARQARGVLREAGRRFSVLSHSIAAHAAFIGGVILLVSATLPALPGNVARLKAVFPAFVPDAAHFVCALSGAALLFVSCGLERRQTGAYTLAAVLLGLGMLGAVLKGLSWEAALMVSVVLLAVCLARRRFYRSSFFWEEPFPVYWLVGALGALGAVFLLGWCIYHPAWDKIASWGFEHPLNASRVFRAYVGIAAALPFCWAWRAIRRRGRRGALQ
ncbi:membrane protein [Deltaproteobacteria bacterium]|nr:membrane protein [Deltaproteobacteria bacterium]